MAGKILIVEAPFYKDLTNMLVDGAVAALTDANYAYARVQVAGVLEIPPAIYFAVKMGKLPNRERYAGFVALGVVIRGQTSHYDTVCNESARGLMELGIRHGAAIGNGIQTVENHEQALARCDKEQQDKGGHAVRACLSLLAAREQIHKEGLMYRDR